MNYLIIGADGYIGSYLYEHLQSEGKQVCGTTRRDNNVGKKIFFDMSLNNIPKPPKGGWQDTMAVICTAQSKIDKCAEGYNEAYDLNVTKTVHLAKMLLDNGAQVLVFSSDQVFDGKMGGYMEDSRHNPLNAYGCMKAEMEKKLEELIPQPCIFRIAKTISDDMTKKNVLTEWMNVSPNGVIRCIKGNIISFVYIGDIYRAVKVAAEKKLHGLYNITGDDVCSRAELARRFAVKLDRKDWVIREEPVEAFGFREQRPLNVTLHNDKFKREADFSFTPMELVMQKYIENLRGNDIVGR